MRDGRHNELLRGEAHGYLIDHREDPECGDH